MQLAYAGPRRRDDVRSVPRQLGPDDSNAENDFRALKVLFDYCDLSLRTVGKAPAAPAEGPRRYELSVRNVGTTPCRRVRIGVAGGGSRAGEERPVHARAGPQRLGRRARERRARGTGRARRRRTDVPAVATQDPAPATTG